MASETSEESDRLWDEKESTCLACPKRCSSCTKDESDCECYEHQNDHPSVRVNPNHQMNHPDGDLC